MSGGTLIRPFTSPTFQTFADSLVPRIRAILSSADLSSISAKGVRKQLVALGYDEATIKASRADIDERISDIFHSLTAEPEPKPAPAPSTSYAPNGSYASGGDDAYTLPQTSQPVPLRDVKPAIAVKPDPYAARVKDEKPVIPSAARAVAPAETDAEMAARLQAEYDTSQAAGRSSRARATGADAPKKKKKAVVKRKSAAVVGSDGEEVEKKKRKGGGGGAFNKELILSDALAALVEEPRLSRPQTVKRIWDYVKARDLQDPSDRRFIRCDERLRTVFGSDRVHMFSMNKILADHFMDPDEAVGGGGGAVERKPKLEPAMKVEHVVAPPVGRSAEVVESDDDDDDDDY